MTRRFRRPLVGLVAGAALLALALLAPVGAAAAARRPACTQRAQSGRRRAACVPRTTSRRAPSGGFGALDGNEYEFDGVQISGTMTARAPRDADFGFRASSTAILRPLVRTEQGPIFRRRMTEVGGRFRFDGDYVFATMSHVGYRIRSEATYHPRNGDPIDCTWNAPTGVDRLGLQIYPKRDRIAIRYTLDTGGWGCRNTVVTPSCGHETGGDASVMFYKEIEFTRRWIKLPIDLQWRTRQDVECAFRWNGYVRLKKLRNGR